MTMLSQMLPLLRGPGSSNFRDGRGRRLQARERERERESKVEFCKIIGFFVI